jgi:hypothetical protein
MYDIFAFATSKQQAQWKKESNKQRRRKEEEVNKKMKLSMKVKERKMNEWMNG